MLQTEAHQYFRTSTNPVAMQLYSRMGLERDSGRCFTKVLVKNFACITYGAHAEYILHKNFTDGSGHNQFVMSDAKTASRGGGIV